MRAEVPIVKRPEELDKAPVLRIENYLWLEGYTPEVITDKLSELGLTLEAILLTHGHFDHVGAVGALFAETDCEVILSAAQQDYDRFYESEIRLRRLRRYPPFADLFTFTVSGTEEGAVLRAAAGVRETLRRLCALPGLAASQPEVLGPAPAPVLKLNNRYRYRVLLVGRNDKATREQVSWLLKEFALDRANRGLNMFVDCNTME